MKFPSPQTTRLLGALAAVWSLHSLAHAQLVIEDKLTGASSSYDWKALNGACLTAGNNTGTIPACMGLPYYNGRLLVGGTSGRLPDAVGSGALRLTNGDVQGFEHGLNGNNQTGAVVSNFSFPTRQGLQVTFRTVTYGGNGFGPQRTGADGIAFFLSDSAKPPTVGAPGGSLGYTCQNGNPLAPNGMGGVQGAYLGIGIDEYGNFGNFNFLTDTGPGFFPNRINLRGAGDIRWESFAEKYPQYYPATLSLLQQGQALNAACASGFLPNFSGKRITDANGKSVENGALTSEAVPNYAWLGYSDMPMSMSNQQGTSMPKRGEAVVIDYAIKISQNGLLDFGFSMNGGAQQTLWRNKSITDINGKLPESFRFGFSGSTGRGSNVHEILCFKAVPSIEANTSAGGNVQQAALKLGTQVYLASYQPLNWWGQLTAQDLVETASGSLMVNPVPNWEANCSLTGGSCPAITPANASAPVTVAAQAPGSRNILTASKGRGMALDWTGLSIEQQTMLKNGPARANNGNNGNGNNGNNGNGIGNSGTNGNSGGNGNNATDSGPKTLDYLRGDRGGEVAGASAMRTRTGLLGDIIDSSPTWVGPPSQTFSAWGDKLFASSAAPEASGQSYDAFKTAYATRQNLVYVGANDGLLHAFKAGAHDASGNFVGNSALTPNDGREALAYMPTAVVESIRPNNPSLDFSSPQYGHNFYVNATPATGDLFYGGAWHTWLVSGLGAGGNATGPIADKTSTAKGSLFALDITDPSKFGQSSAASIVVGDWTTDTITCTNLKNCGEHLGSVYGTPLIRRLHSGQWAVLFGNGLNSSSGTAGLFIMLVDPTSGITSFRFLATGTGPVAGNKNGISYVASADLDGDHITDYVYGGDVMGNLWRFDLTAADAANWAAGSSAIFKAPSNQPITAKPVVAIVPGKGTEGRPRVIVGVGTGQRFPQTQAQDVSYASGSHALYGIWDANLADWNSKGGAQFASLSTVATVLPSDLLLQNVTAATAGNSLTISERVVSSRTVCWKEANICANAADNKHLGWTLPLPATNEQAFYNPAIEGSHMVVNTLIPTDKQAIQACDLKKTPTGYTMAVSMGEGGASAQPFFASTTGVAVNGIGLGATGTPMFIRSSKGKNYAINQTVRLDANSSARIATGDGFIDCSASGRCSTGNRVLDEAGIGKRINWVKRR
jgi:type IV pilus assembly protein PilY1